MSEEQAKDRIIRLPNDILGLITEYLLYTELAKLYYTSRDIQRRVPIVVRTGECQTKIRE